MCIRDSFYLVSKIFCLKILFLTRRIVHNNPPFLLYIRLTHYTKHNIFPAIFHSGNHKNISFESKRIRQSSFILCRILNSHVTNLFTAVRYSYSISRIILRIGSTKVGETESSSTPISIKVSVNDISAPSSPQIPAQIPSLCAF